MAGSKYITLIFSILFIKLVDSSNSNTTFRHLSLAPVTKQGTESIEFDCKGEGPYVGISNGRILKWKGRDIGWTKFAVTKPNRPAWCDGVLENLDSSVEKVCGRPLGLIFDMVTCEMYVVDSSSGLMKVGPEGGIATLLASGVEGKPFKFANDLDIDHEKKVVYFTDSSTKYHRWESGKLLKSDDRSGRFLKYDIKTGKVTVLHRNLAFANGLALSKEKDFVVVGETNGKQILKFWLTDSKVGSYEVFLRFTGKPHNINRDANGDFWIAETMANSIKVNKFGKILEYLDRDKTGDNPNEIQEFNGCIWIGSIETPYLRYSCRKGSKHSTSFN